MLTPFRKAFANRSVEELFSCCEGPVSGFIFVLGAVAGLWVLEFRAEFSELSH